MAGGGGPGGEWVMDLWPSDLNQFLLSLSGRKLFHDIGAGGFLPCDHQQLSCQLALLATFSPAQLIFFHASPEATLLVSYQDPDAALSSVEEWAGGGAEVCVISAGLLAID